MSVTHKFGFNNVNSYKAAKVLYERAGPVICRTLERVSHSPLESVRMCAYLMTVNTFDIMCEVSDYVDVGVHACEEVFDVFTITLIYRAVIKETINANMRKAFSACLIQCVRLHLHAFQNL